MTDNLSLGRVSASQNQKEVTLNAALDGADGAISGVLQFDVGNDNVHTVTTADFQDFFFFQADPGGTPPTGDVTITLPAIERGLFAIFNNTAEVATVTSDAQVLIAPTLLAGELRLFMLDGTDVRAIDTTDLAPAPVEEFIYVPVEERVRPTATGGCAALATVAVAADQPDITSLNFDQTTAEHAQLREIFEDPDLLGNISLQFVWSHAAATTFGLAWLAKALALSNDDAIGVAFGAARKVIDTGGTTNDHYVSGRTGFIKISNPVDLDMVVFDIFRDPTDAGDDLDVDARLQGVIINFWRNIPLDPDWASVSLLAGFDGEDAATDQDDESDSAHVATYVANAQVDTAQSIFSKGSLLLDGTGDIVTFPDSADFALGSGDFTLECQARWSADTQSGDLIAHYDTSINQRSYVLERDQSSGNLRVIFSTDGTNFFIDLSATWAPVVGTWHHIALDFDGTTYRLYVDGAILTTSTTLRTLHDSTAVFSLGGRGDATVLFTGNLDEVRVTKGVARYAGAFLPPTGPFPRG